MDTKNYELQTYFGKPQPPSITRVVQNIDRILNKATIIAAERMEIEALTRRYEGMRPLGVITNER
jgi:hypothetical protein